jgi:hypothetical protein
MASWVSLMVYGGRKGGPPLTHGTLCKFSSHVKHQKVTWLLSAQLDLTTPPHWNKQTSLWTCGRWTARSPRGSDNCTCIWWRVVCTTYHPYTPHPWSPLKSPKSLRDSHHIPPSLWGSLVSTEQETTRNGCTKSHEHTIFAEKVHDPKTRSILPTPTQCFKPLPTAGEAWS